MPTVVELRKERAKLVHDARKHWEDVEKRNKDSGDEPTQEERDKLDTMLDDAVKLGKTIEKREADSTRLATLDDLETSLGSTPTPKTRGAGEPRKKNPDDKPGPQLFTFRENSRLNKCVVPLEGWRASEEYRAAFLRFFASGEKTAPPELRALQKDDDSAGGYLSAPMQFQAELIKTLDEAVFMRQICRVLPPVTSAESLGAPSLEADPADPTWVAEINIGSEDSTMSFGKRELIPHPLASFIKVSRTLLRRSQLAADTIVRDRLAFKLGVIQENAFLNGTGALQPLGVFIASADGIPTGRDVNTGNTTTAFTFDGLIEAKMSLRPPYRTNASWIFHTDAVKMAMKLKDGEGRYIWQQSVIPMQPDTILGHRVFESERAPNTFTTGLYVGMIGDFQWYWIVDALTMTIEVLDQLYAGTNQNGYLARAEADGMPVLGEAFARVTLA